MSMSPRHLTRTIIFAASKRLRGVCARGHYSISRYARRGNRAIHRPVHIVTNTYESNRNVLTNNTASPSASMPTPSTVNTTTLSGRARGCLLINLQLIKELTSCLLILICNLSRVGKNNKDQPFFFEIK